MNHGQAMDTFGQVDSTGRAGCADAQPAQPAQPPPMGYMMPDPLPPPWYWATDFYRRKRRRPRCEGGEG